MSKVKTFTLEKGMIVNVKGHGKRDVTIMSAFLSGDEGHWGWVDGLHMIPVSPEHVTKVIREAK